MLSYIVLQHMEPRYAKRYIAEFVRVLKVGAVRCSRFPPAFRLPSIRPSVAGGARTDPARGVHPGSPSR